MGDQFCFEIGGGSYFGWKFMGDEEYEGTRTNSPAVPDSVVFHEAAVGLHGVEAGHKSRKQGHDGHLRNRGHRVSTMSHGIRPRT